MSDGIINSSTSANRFLYFFLFRDAVSFTLPDRSVGGTVTRVKDLVDRGFIYSGEVEGGTFKMVVSTTFEYVVTVEVPAEQALYELSLVDHDPTSDINSYVMRKVLYSVYEDMERNGYMSEDDAIVRSSGQGASLPVHRDHRRLQGETDFNPDGISTIELMLVYTPQAAAAAGGESQMRLLCDMAVDDFNVALDSSGITPQVTVTLLCCEPVASGYVESSFSSMLMQMRTFDSIPLENGMKLSERRDALHADAAHLLVANRASCGMGSYSYNANTDGFSVGNYDTTVL